MRLISIFFLFYFFYVATINTNAINENEEKTNTEYNHESPHRNKRLFFWRRMMRRCMIFGCGGYGYGGYYPMYTSYYSTGFYPMYYSSSYIMYGR
uniref:Uncharacterized protein n=1 Tax=Strongyloides papillosus TaxID=174720 RepID=A0A0N5BX10_STREA